MDNESLEKRKESEQPTPEVKPDRNLPEYGIDARPHTETAGAKAAELPQVSPDPSLQSTAPDPSHTTPAASSPSQKSSSHAPVIADDNDLIEKEWVQKAKTIVTQTKDDPYQQNKQMSSYKADYIKKRFNKDVKVNEG